MATDLRERLQSTLGSAYTAGRQQGNRNARLQNALDEAEVDVWFRDDTARALAAIDRALAEHPLDSLAPVERPHSRLVRIYSLVGRPDRARAYLAAFDERRQQVGRNNDERVRHRMLGDIAIAERRYDEAVREFRAGDAGSCTTCSHPTLARVYDLAGTADSAIAFFERYTSDPAEPVRMWDIDGLNLAGAHKRLGELYEAKGQREKAASHYAKFLELWKDADPELQPHVHAVRERLRNLQRVERP